MFSNDLCHVGNIFSCINSQSSRTICMHNFFYMECDLVNNCILVNSFNNLSCQNTSKVMLKEEDLVVFFFF